MDESLSVERSIVDHPLFQKAIANHQLGELNQAQALYDQLLIDFPKDYRLLSNKGTLLMQLGDLEQGIAFIQNSLQQNPQQPHAYNSIANASQALGRHAEAVAYYNQAIVLDASFAEAHMNRGITLAQIHDYNAALANFNQAIILRKDYIEAYLNKGKVYEKLNHYDEALAIYNQALQLAPENPALLMNRAHLYRVSGRLALSLEDYERLISLVPRWGDAYLGMGIVFTSLGRYEEALINFRMALEIKPDDANVYASIGTLYSEQGKYDEALTFFERALDIHPGAPECYSNMGNTLFKLRRYEEALRCQDKALLLMPHSTQILINKGVVLQETGRYEEAYTCFKLAYRTDKDHTEVLADMIHLLQKNIDWSEQPMVMADLTEALKAGFLIGGPFSLLSMVDDPLLHRKCAHRYVASKGWLSTNRMSVRSLRRKIKVGYFSSDYVGHPVAQNLEAVIRFHNKDRFEIIAFDYGIESERKHDTGILPLFDAVFSVGNMADRDAAGLVRDMGIDIAVDLNGHTKGARTGIFNEAPAPVIINYLGYPGTMGASFYDVIIADALVIPKAHEAYYAEKIARLPHFFMPYSFDAALDPRDSHARDRFNLPADRFILCSFNDFYKITESVFFSWMNILKSAPNALLLIANRSGREPEFILKRVLEYGVCVDRIIFAPRLDSSEEHLERLGQCDLMLDTFPYNSHTTACDAIRAGLPILTIKGLSFASRVTASLLGHMGLHDLVKTSVRDYEDIAIRLATSPDLYKTIRRNLIASRSKLPSSAEYASNIESLYTSLIGPI